MAIFSGNSPKRVPAVLRKYMVNLTDAEAAVFVSLMRGKSAVEIGDDVGIGPATAITYTKNIYRKLGVHSHPELMAKVLWPLMRSSTAVRKSK